MAPWKHESAFALLACMWVGGAGLLAWPAAVELDAGEQVSPWSWLMVGVLLLAAAGSYWWDELWRALHPPIRFDLRALPQPFDWGEVARRVAAFRDAEGEGDSPEESDSVYLMIRDSVTPKYVDIVRKVLSTGGRGSSG